MRFLLPLLALTLSAGELTGPAPALFYDAVTRSVRSIIGIPGAAYVGAEVIADADAARMSPDGKSLAIVRGQSLIVIRGAESTTLCDNLATTSLTWSDDSKTLAAGTRVWEAGVERDVPETSAASIAGATSIALSGRTLYIADSERGEVKALLDYTQAGNAVLAAKLDNAVAVAATKTLLLVATKNKVVGLRAGTYEPVFDLALDFEPTSLVSLGQAGWLLNAGTNGALQVLSIEQEAAVYFIPRQEEN